MKKNYLIVGVFLLWLGCTGNVYAGWPIGKYRHVFIPSVTYYSSKNYWNRSGTYIKGSSGNVFNALNTGLYLGMGISRRADVLISVNYSAQSSKVSGVTQSSINGFGDASLGLSYNLAAFKYKRFLSVQGTFIAPLYTISNVGNTFGYGVAGAEGKLMFSGAAGDRTYFNLEGGYRRYFDEKGPQQALYTASFGGALDSKKRNQLTFDVSGVHSFSSNDNLRSVNPNLVYDGYYIKVSATYGYQFTNRLSLFGSAFYTPIGRNAPQGYGATLFAVIKF